MKTCLCVPVCLYFCCMCELTVILLKNVRLFKLFFFFLACNMKTSVLCLVSFPEISIFPKKNWQWNCGCMIINTGSKYFCHLWQCKFDLDFMWSPNHTLSKSAWQFLCKPAFIKGLMPHSPECIMSTLVHLFCLLLMFMHRNVDPAVLWGWFPRKMAFWF